MASYSSVHGERVTYGATEEDGQLCNQVPKRKEQKERCRRMMLKTSTSYCASTDPKEK